LQGVLFERQGSSPLRTLPKKGTKSSSAEGGVGFADAAGHAPYRQALALAEPRGMRPLVAHCYLGLGKLYLRTDRREQAQEHLTTASAMYREMDMRFWLEKAEAELNVLR
jgi:hypothetical protein